MIVRKQNGSLLLIRQIDHSAHVGEFARDWGNAQFERPMPSEAVVLGATYHDDGWREQDEQPLYDAQRRAPLHWRDIPVADHVRFYGQGAARASVRDPYAGLLASMHASGIYTRRYGTAQVRMSKLTDDVRDITETFVTEQEAIQAALKRQVWSSTERRSEFEHRLWFNYELLQIWDRLSLFMCLNDLDHPASDRIGPTPLKVAGPVMDLTVQAKGDHVVTIAPYPLAISEVTMVIPARVIPDRPYDSAEDLQRALHSAREAPIRCRIVAGRETS